LGYLKYKPKFGMNTDFKIPLYTGATAGARYYSKNQKRCLIDGIKEYVANVGKDFNDVLRMNQLGATRYKYITFIISDPKKQSEKYKDMHVIGLFYEDIQPVDNIRFKQDFILSQGSGYTFVIGNSWFIEFPTLLQFSSYLWNYARFDGEIANGKHYQSNGQFNHHYNIIDDLPLEIAKYYRRNFSET